MTLFWIWVGVVGAVLADFVYEVVVRWRDSGRAPTSFDGRVCDRCGDYHYQGKKCERRTR